MRGKFINLSVLIPLAIIALVAIMFFNNKAFAFESISATELHKITKKLPANAVVFDVRTIAETNQGHIKGMLNKNFHDGDFDAFIGKLDKEKTYYVICHSGGRSSSASKKMEKAGFKKIINISGGMRSWKSKGFPVK